ncbi:MAG: hypothetical protein ACYC6Y_15405, partial [Thermoguttaceae bacterium]
MVERNRSDDVPGQLLRALFRFRYRSISFFAASVACAALLTALMPKSYRSEAKLFLRMGRENVALDPTATLGESGIVQMPASREQEIKTVVELLGARELKEKVVSELTSAAILSPTSPEEDGDSREQGSALPLASWFGAAVGTLNGWLVAARIKAPLTERDEAILTVESQLDVEAVRDTNVVRVSYESTN